MSGYAELATATNFSFLRGASSAQDLVATALALGHTGMGVADRNTVAGVVRAFAAWRRFRDNEHPTFNKVKVGSSPGEHIWVENPEAASLRDFHEILVQRAQTFHLAVGARLAFADATPDIIVYPEDRDGWGRLCRLLTQGNLRGGKGECILRLDDLLADTRGLLLIVAPERSFEGLSALLIKLREAAPGALWLGARMGRRGDDRRRLARFRTIAATAEVALVAINDALYHGPEQRDLQDVLTCIREGVTIERAGRRLEINAERHLKSPEEMARLFQDCPEAIGEIDHILSRVGFSLAQLRYEYPEEPVPPGWTPFDWLEELTWRRAPMFYDGDTPQKVRKLLREELALIKQLDYARYFLTIYDLVRVAENKGILCQGRGSAANSAVCYVLGVTAVDPNEHDVLFARFISSERSEPPDIDVDFEHERREEIIQHIYERFGRERASIVATVISYRPRSAIRDVGKALGLSEDVTARLAGMVWGGWGDSISDQQVAHAGLDPKNPTVRRAIDLAMRLLGFPRHLSQHVGGFVLSGRRLDEITPIGNAAMKDRTFIEWDRDDIDEIGLMKVDVLALGMLTCIRKALVMLRDFEGVDYGLKDVPKEDKATYDMLCKGDSIGVFQVESRAQINMLPRLRPREFYDLVVQVAIVRPGPIEGEMVHPYLRRRSRLEEAEFPGPTKEPENIDELRQILGKTYGVPLFQEQAMKLAMVAARFTPEEANGLRKAMATFRHAGTIHLFETKMIEGMVARGYERDFAKRCFDQIKGFGSYGFPESHAASFAKLVYVSSWIKRHHPAIFAAALLNSQPMGFYAPAQIVRDACDHDVEARGVDVNASYWYNSLERREDGALALRLGFRQISGFREDWATALVEARKRPYDAVEDIARRAALPARALRLLADADAFRSIGQDRREALWAARRLPDDRPLPLFAAANARELAEEADARLPRMALSEHVATDYQTTGLSLKAHPMRFLRRNFDAERVATCAGLCEGRDGAWGRVVGIVLVRQRPGGGKAIFMTLEDETGIVNILLWSRKFERFRRQVMSARLMVVEGVIQRSPENVVHLMAETVFDRTADLKLLCEEQDMRPFLSRGDEAARPQAPRNEFRHPRDVRILPKSRDFH